MLRLRTASNIYKSTVSVITRYALIEGEALAVVDALAKARFFVLGWEIFIVAVDHKPLL